MSYANSLGPGEHAHPCSLIWTFSVCRHILQYPLILSADNAGPDQPARMRRMIRACVVRKLYKGPFRALRIKYGLAHGKRDPMVFRFWGSSNTHEQSSVCFFFSFLFIYLFILFYYFLTEASSMFFLHFYESKGSGETAFMRSLAFAGRLCDYPFLLRWSIFGFRSLVHLESRTEYIYIWKA